MTTNTLTATLLARCWWRPLGDDYERRDDDQPSITLRAGTKVEVAKEDGTPWVLTVKTGPRAGVQCAFHELPECLA